MEPPVHSEMVNVINAAIEEAQKMNPNVKSLMVKTASNTFACRACNQQYSVSSNLRQHVESKHCPQEYDCPCCFKKMFIRNSFVSHMKRHILEL